MRWKYEVHDRARQRIVLDVADEGREVLARHVQVDDRIGALVAAERGLELTTVHRDRDRRLAATVDDARI
jgi:hypothetical protein